MNDGSDNRTRDRMPRRQNHLLKTIIESPYAGTNHPISSELGVALHLRYLRACMRDSLLRGEAPYASHGLYTQPGVLEDLVPEERKMGIEAGFAWREHADVTAIYTDMGISSGMRLGAEHAQKSGARIEERSISPEALLLVKQESEDVPGFVRLDNGKYSFDEPLLRIFQTVGPVLGEALANEMGAGSEIHPMDLTRAEAESMRAKILAMFGGVPR